MQGIQQAALIMSAASVLQRAASLQITLKSARNMTYVMLNIVENFYYIGVEAVLGE
jgi:hypothetical protein